MNLTVTLALPPRLLFKNAAAPASRFAKMGRSQAIARVRGEARLLTSQVARLPWPPGKVAVRAVFHFKDRRAKHDPANLHFPLVGVLDGIQDAIGVNDSQFIVAQPEIEYGCRKLVVTLASVGEPAAPVPPVTNYLRQCPTCGRRLVRATMPNRITCLECPGRVYEEAMYASYPWK